MRVLHRGQSQALFSGEPVAVKGDSVTLKFDLVIFDCDGVLVDSMAISNGTLVEMLRELGVTVSLEESNALYMGRSLPAIIEDVSNRFGVSVPHGFPNEYYLRMEAAFRKGLRPVPGIIEAPDKITLPKCVASSAPHRKMNTTLRVTGLMDRFEGCIFSAADVGRGKPFPDLFLYAARQMGSEAHRCVVIEDAVPGVQAAVSAGMSVFGYAADSDGDSLREAGATVFDGMANLPDLLEG